MPQRRRYTKQFKEEALRLVGHEGCFGEAEKVQQGVTTRSRVTCYRGSTAWCVCETAFKNSLLTCHSNNPP